MIDQVEDVKSNLQASKIQKKRFRDLLFVLHFTVYYKMIISADFQKTNVLCEVFNSFIAIISSSSNSISRPPK